MENEDSTPAVNDSAVQDTATTDSASDENNDLEQGNDNQQDFEQEDAQHDQSQDGGQEADDDSSGEADNQPQTKGEKRKDSLNTEIRDLVSQRNQIRDEIEQMNSQVYQAASVDDLLDQENPDTGENYSRLEAQVEMMRQQQELRNFNDKVADFQFTMNQEINRVLSDFPMFDPQNKEEYNEQVAKDVYQNLVDSLQIDPNTGQIIGSTLKSPYKLYQSYANAAQSSARKGELKGQRNAERMMTNVDHSTGGQGKSSKSFNELSASEMREELRRKGHDI